MPCILRFLILSNPEIHVQRRSKSKNHCSTVEDSHLSGSGRYSRNRQESLSYFEQVEDMLNEVKLGQYTETGEYITDITLAELIKLYINHRPAFGISAEELVTAFEVLGEPGGPAGKPVLDRDRMLELLQVRGRQDTFLKLPFATIWLLPPKIQCPPHFFLNGFDGMLKQGKP